ncbi:(2Fe-2S)-binding protein [Pandoraea terrae]|uniref:(2Fe-2S)-binding protein n=1 Tax=Pandoraea terrae TaxID=1537710 RepID=A0A5E4ZE61_9BURK|nr:2Fe-2S iron-sulfur cluster-binding protein [Pandoraea terrae]VVE59671.1 (2Fe-2S)-binding protein [Pandoraea terrae]
MPKAIFTTDEGTRTELDVRAGTSLMHAAVSNGIHEIVGDCGGSASCATCHVYIDEPYVGKCPAISPAEEGMLQSTAAERRPNSRLSCQIVMTEQLDGITVHIANPQW